MGSSSVCARLSIKNGSLLHREESVSGLNLTKSRGKGAESRQRRGVAVHSGVLPPRPHEPPRHHPGSLPVRRRARWLCLAFPHACRWQSGAGAIGSAALPCRLRRGTGLSPLGLSPAGHLIGACSALPFVHCPPCCPLLLPAPKCGDPPAGLICLPRPAAAGADGEAARGSSASTERGLVTPSQQLLCWPRAVRTGVGTSRGAAARCTPQARSSVPCASRRLAPAPCGNTGGLDKILHDVVFSLFSLRGKAVAACVSVGGGTGSPEPGTRPSAWLCAAGRGCLVPATSPCLPPSVFNGPSFKCRSVNHAGCIWKFYPC